MKDFLGEFVLWKYMHIEALGIVTCKQAIERTQLHLMAQYMDASLNFAEE
jgi:hypothetical protein